MDSPTAPLGARSAYKAVYGFSVEYAIDQVLNLRRRAGLSGRLAMRSATICSRT